MTAARGEGWGNAGLIDLIPCTAAGEECSGIGEQCSGDEGKEEEREKEEGEATEQATMHRH